MALVVLVGLAGCSQADGDDATPGGPAPAAGTGIVRGVVVDNVIRPLADVSLSLAIGGAERAGITTADGRFEFRDVPAGTYILRARHLLYQDTQTTVDVKAGDADPPLVNLQMQRLFEQAAFHETLKFDGFIQCGYSISGVMSSLCVNDYTHFVGPYTCPDCEHLVDDRSFDFAVGAGWQAMVFEMTWDPSAQGTSPEMRLIVSHFPRPASHAYCSVASPDPVYVRMDVGEDCAGQQDDPAQVPPEGLPNMHMFAATSAPAGTPASVAFSQSFSVFMNFFYYGKPPEGWSFLNGDAFPF